MTSEPRSAAMERTEREKLAYRIQGIMSLTLSVEDGEIMGTGQASFQSADLLLATIETLTRERDEAREALRPGRLVTLPISTARLIVKALNDAEFETSSKRISAGMWRVALEFEIKHCEKIAALSKEPTP